MEKLESYVIDNALKEKIVADFKEQVESVNDALERLKAEDIPCDLPTLKKIMSSDESFKKWLVKAEDEFIGKLGFLPMEERKRIGVSFANVFKRTANDRNTVASFLSDPKYPIVQGKDGSLQYDWQEVEKGAEQRATRHFTDEDVEYFGMLRKVVESLEDLEAWETEHAFLYQYLARAPYSAYTDRRTAGIYSEACRRAIRSSSNPCRSSSPTRVCWFRCAAPSSAPSVKRKNVFR